MSSATGGPLVPALPDALALRRFFQGLIVGITGLPNTMVRPRWQPDPPPMPDIATDWLAFDLRTRTADANAYVTPVDDLTTRLIRHERVTLACSFYGPNGSAHAEVLRDGLELSQNREPLLLAGIGYVGAGDTVQAPELHNDRWYERHDVELRFNRETGKVYEILPFAGALGAIITETLTLPFATPIPSP